MANWNPRANELFLNALDFRTDEERRAFLDASCGADQELRQAVEALLRANAAAGSFLEKPDLTAANSGPAAVADSQAENAGTIIGGRLMRGRQAAGPVASAPGNLSS